MARIRVSKDPSGHIIVSFPYDPLLIAAAKTIPSHKWHPVEKYCSKTTEIYIHVSTRNISRIRSPLDNLDLRKGGRNENNQ
jgi:hypothetical protein